MSVLSKIIPKDRSERDYDGFSLDEIYEMGWNDCKFKMEEIDAVPVVRCKDCSRQCICYHSADYYCADGEKVTE